MKKKYFTPFAIVKKPWKVCGNSTDFKKNEPVGNDANENDKDEDDYHAPEEGHKPWLVC